MSALKCPFCGSDNLAIGTEQLDEDFWQGAVHCEKCGVYGPLAFRDTEEDAAEDAWVAWNTRHERTCHDLHDKLTRSFECSECGYVVGDQPLPRESFAYCPGCGAKVVEE